MSWFQNSQSERSDSFKHASKKKKPVQKKKRTILSLILRHTSLPFKAISAAYEFLKEKKMGIELGFGAVMSLLAVCRTYAEGSINPFKRKDSRHLQEPSREHVRADFHLLESFKEPPNPVSCFDQETDTYAVALPAPRHRQALPGFRACVHT